ncbi:hypothetical protein SKAU_G00192440 [Synaphobranchus kaupii]|uniref:ZP domain-containing protein n=1 Tax=Synaphobranchus kaupii TaxID=118154 RepID=A0A9Q1FE80_SYNKA|nr:hypothetical protein SKAU_G00192440 [Synaphobranchus kaupii]
MRVKQSFCLGVFLFSSLVFPLVDYADAQRGPIESECRDRYLIIYVDQAIASQGLRVEAIDATGVYPIDETNGDACGYTRSFFNMDGYIVLRASYYSCHTENQNDQLFTFKFNIIATDHLSKQAVHHVAKTCSLPLPWSDREVTCEENYMEVTVQSDVQCTLNGPSPKKAWDSTLSVAQASMVSGWQVMFLVDGNEVTMSIDDVRALGYGVDVTANRVVFRSPYMQPHSKIMKVDGIDVVVIRATMSFRQKWMAKMVDVSAACTMNPADFDTETRRVFWEIPTVMAPLVYDRSEFVSKQVNVGVEGQLLDENVWKARGYFLDISGPMMHLSVPFGAEGGYRTSLVLDNAYNEFYVIYLYYEHLFMDGVLETRHRIARAYKSPLLLQYPFTIDQTVLEEFVFTVYLGNFPPDVELVTVRLNAETFSVSEAFQSGYTISEIPHPNGTHAYIIKVPFEDSIVPRMYLGEGLLQYSLDINYTLNIMPQQDSYYHLASVVALLKDAFPPDFQAICTERSIIFKMAHQNLGHVWEVTIGNYPLTPELAARRGYILQNTSQSLTMEVPVFTTGYIYEEITLNHFFGTFEVLSRDAKTLDIQKSTAKRCLFNTDELIVCSTDGVMTVVASLAAAIPSLEPSRTTLLDKNCKPWDTDTTRVLFVFGMNTCGTKVLVDDQYIVYENEIVFHREFEPEGPPIITRDSEFRLTVQCLYEVKSTNRLFVDKMFKSETPGFGAIKVEGSSPKEYGKVHESTPIHSDHSYHTASHVSSSYSVDQSASHPNGYLASRVHIANVVPSTQQAPNRVQPIPGHYGTREVAMQPLVLKLFLVTMELAREAALPMSLVAIELLMQKLPNMDLAASIQPLVPMELTRVEAI